MDSGIWKRQKDLAKRIWDWNLKYYVSACLPGDIQLVIFQWSVSWFSYQSGQDNDSNIFYKTFWKILLKGSGDIIGAIVAVGMYSSSSKIRSITNLLLSLHQIILISKIAYNYIFFYLHTPVSIFISLSEFLILETGFFHFEQHIKGKYHFYML